MKNYKLFFYLGISLLILCSAIAKSQNSGPTAPEVMQFEPADATDMVNLITGDVSYVLPLLTVPGPEGGYPVVLSYHAGIPIEMESSWVGLGWNINTGEINRAIRGVADDLNGTQNHTSMYDYLKTSTNSFVSINSPFPQVPIGVSVSWGSNWSVGGYVIFGGVAKAGLEVGSAGSNVSIGIGSQSGGYSIGVTTGSNGTAVYGNIGSLSASVGSNGVSLGISSSYSFGNWSVPLTSIGVSLSSSGSSVGLSVLGFTAISQLSAINSKNVSSSTSGWNYNFIYIDFGSSKTKYFYYQGETKFDYGALYMKSSLRNSDKPYHYNPVQSTDIVSDVIVYPYSNTYFDNFDDVEKNCNLMLPAYDLYQVNSQGLNGSMSPKYFSSRLIYGNGRAIKTGIRGIDYEYDNNNWMNDIKDEIRYHNVLSDLPNIAGFADHIYFYFDCAYESYLKIREGDFSNHSGDPFWGNTDFNGGQQENSANYNPSKKRKVNSKHVEWFTNNEIISNEQDVLNRGFLESRSLKDDEYENPRENSDLFEPDGIGAYSITVEDGKTYHYSIPVYQFEHITNNELNSTDFYEQITNGKYAYTWLLTSITGPDYVDRPDGNNELGTVGEEDYGYWVEFEYGKWTDGYIWQLPYIKPSYKKPYTWGRKQIYYLNSIKTKTHTALFIKSLRFDGLGSMGQNLSKAEYVKSEYVGEPGENKTFVLEPGYFNCQTNEVLTTSKGYLSSDEWRLTGYFEKEIEEKHKSLKLEKIILLKNETLQHQNLSTTNTTNLITNPNDDNFLHWHDKLIRPDRGCFSMTPAFIPCYQFCRTIGLANFKVNQQDNVYDITDISGKNIETVAISTVNFNYDYSLCPGTPNSDAGNGGKLSLKSISFAGKNNIRSLPPYVFKYWETGETSYSSKRADEWGFDYIHPNNW
ncbi:MAG TPA: hypothetical protein VHI78_08530, partial [Bacteroidales bacterium]|nr:hypothetical protein [Bacteroidales bacterium]